MVRWLTNTIVGITSILLIGVLSCKKHAPPAKAELTPLQGLINTDSTLTLYHLMILRANDVVLLNDAPVTVLIPRNAVLLQSGYPEQIIDSMSSALADRIVRYNYLPSAINTDSVGSTANPTLLGVPLYIGKNGSGQLLLNGSVTASDVATSVGQASVYFLDSIVPPAADSLTEIVQADSTLTYFNEVLNRTNLYDSLLQTGSYTLLAPSNTAFQNAGYDSIGAIDSAGIDTLLQLAMSQVIKGAYFSNNFPATVMTLYGGNVTVTTVNGFLQFAGAGNAIPINWLYGNQVAGPTLILHHTDGIVSP